MDIKATTFDNGENWKEPIIEISTEYIDNDLSFYYSSTNSEKFGMQIDNHSDADKIKQLCFDIDKKLRKIYKLVNK